MELNQLLKKEKLTMIDLCAGTGGFSYAFESTQQVSTIFANDFLKSSEKLYNHNFSISLAKKDLHDIQEDEIPPCHILTAGFPCQSFSISGLRKGFQDERSNVFWKILSIIKAKSPDIILLENVKHLQTHDQGKTFQTIIESLKQLNYFVKYKVLNTCKITQIPQNRERIYIIGFKDERLFDSFHFDFPEITNQPISTFLEKEVPSKYYYTEKSSIFEKLKESITQPISTNKIYQYRRYYVRENKNSVCPTLTANMGTGGHNVPLLLDVKGIRKLTPRECFRLQGFPDHFEFSSLSDSLLYQLAGNSICVEIVYLIALRLLESIKNL